MPMADPMPTTVNTAQRRVRQAIATRPGLTAAEKLQALVAVEKAWQEAGL